MNRIIPILQTTGMLIFLQQGPQTMPGDRQTLITIIILYLAVVALSHIPLDVNPLQALMVGVLEAAILAGFFHAVLTIAKKPGRFVQCYGSILMVSTVMNFLSIPSKAIVIPQWQAIFRLFRTRKIRQLSVKCRCPSLMSLFCWCFLSGLLSAWALFSGMRLKHGWSTPCSSPWFTP